MKDFIGKEYQDWGGCDDVFVETPTGSGKTTFVLEVLSQYAMEAGKEVLLLVNRKILKRQIKKELAEDHGIENISDEELDQINEFAGLTILSYQELQEELKRKPLLLGRFYAKRYRYIVFDESHYILQDAMFNRDIEYLIRAIPKRRNATKIFLSATMDEVRPFLMGLLHPNEMELCAIRDEKGKKVFAYQQSIFTWGRIYFYSQGPKFRIKSLQYFRDISEISEVINEEKSGEKWLIFVNSKREAGILKKSLKKEFSYLDAEVDEDDPVKRQIETENKFEADVLITTKVLDNGINLIDEKLKNIVLLTTEKTEFLQMLGRKRFQDDGEGVKVYITRRSAGYFNARRNSGMRSDQRYIEALENNSQFRQERFDDIEFVSFCQKMVIMEEG